MDVFVLFIEFPDAGKLFQWISGFHFYTFWSYHSGFYGITNSN